MTRNRQILLVENDPRERAALGRMLEGWGYTVIPASGEEAESRLRSSLPALMIVDFDIPGLNFLSFLGRAGESPVVFTSGRASVEEAVTMMRAGAFDFLLKPLDSERLSFLMARVFPDTPSGGEKRGSFFRIVAQDPGMLRVLDLTRQVADSRASVLIQGESGTGKELVARFIHENSRRSQGPFVAVNCAALPEALLESELFGHEKGAFTGAVAAKPGKFELACGGTLLLDEITEMPLHLQSKLLRVLQEREIDRVGGRRPIPVDIRVIATTNREMKETIEKKEFREDLYYRLNVIPVRLPPLRERPGDVALLARHFIAKYNELDERNVKDLTEAAIQKLLTLSFKGNVRELENIMERAVLLCDGIFIRPQDLLEPDIPAFRSVEDLGNAFSEADSPPQQLRDVEKNLIVKTLDQTGGNRTHAAKILGISVRTLRNKLNEYRGVLED